MSSPLDRRRFIQSTAAAGMAAAAYQSTAAEGERKGANDSIVMAIMGTNGRGQALARGFAAQPGVHIAYICDVDERAVAKGIKAAASGGAKEPTGLTDFRKALDDAAVDALVCAAPNHWHGPATILGCSAGKHVYVEKPCSHNPREGELMIEAARKHDRVVQMGAQRRSSPQFVEVVERLRDGVIGRVLFSRSWYGNRRPSIGHGKPSQPPSWLDYTLWQGPAPDRPFKSNIIHYNWHWHWHWGNGELGNNGVHSIDICRWALGVDYPSRVTSGGGKYRHDDDQQTADTHIVTFDFPEGSIVWEGLSWSPRGFEQSSFGMSFHGDEGTLVVADGGYKIFDMRNKEVESRGGGSSGQSEHFANFLACIRDNKRPNADIEEAHKSTLLCHLGNIAQRTGHTLHTNPENGHILDDETAQAMWRREYRPGWEPKV